LEHQRTVLDPYPGRADTPWRPGNNRAMSAADSTVRRTRPNSFILSYKAPVNSQKKQKSTDAVTNFLPRYRQLSDHEGQPSANLSLNFVFAQYRRVTYLVNYCYLESLC